MLDPLLSLQDQMEAPQRTLVLRTLNDTDVFRQRLKVLWGGGGARRFHTRSQSFHTPERLGAEPRGSSPDLTSSRSLVSAPAKRRHPSPGSK